MPGWRFSRVGCLTLRSAAGSGTGLGNSFVPGCGSRAIAAQALGRPAEKPLPCPNISSSPRVCHGAVPQGTFTRLSTQWCKSVRYSGSVWRSFQDGVALKALMGQASCLSMNDGQDARPPKIAGDVENATPHGATVAEYVTVFLTSQDCHGLRPRNDTPDHVFARRETTKQSQRAEIRYRIYENVYLVSSHTGAALSAGTTDNSRFNLLRALFSNCLTRSRLVPKWSPNL